MDNKLLGTLGRIAGLGGLSLGIVFLLLRDFLKEQFLPAQGLDSNQAYHLLLAVLIFSFGIGAVGVVAWIAGRRSHRSASYGGTVIVATLAIFVVVAAVYGGTTGNRTSGTGLEAAIAGHVTDGKTFQPVRGANVSVSGYTATTSTESNGNFYLKFRLRESDEAVRLHVEKDGYSPEDRSVVPQQDTVEIPLTPTPVEEACVPVPPLPPRGSGHYEVIAPFVYTPEMNMLVYVHPHPDGNFNEMMQYEAPMTANIDYDSFATSSFRECLDRCLAEAACDAAEYFDAGRSCHLLKGPFNGCVFPSKKPTYYAGKLRRKSK